jgi:protein deglycase
MLHIFLADGFEEIEAFTTMDVLRRCGLTVQTIAIAGKRTVVGAHSIPTMADTIINRSELKESEGFILPGGMPGAKTLLACEPFHKALLLHAMHNRLIAAICAAPMVLGLHGILEGHRATCYPGFEHHLHKAAYSGNLLEIDGNIITAKGPAAVLPFAFAIAARFVDNATIAQVRKDMLLTDEQG